MDCLQAVLTFLLGRAGVFADDDAQTLYTNQLRTGAAQFDNLQSKRCGVFGAASVSTCF